MSNITGDGGSFSSGNHTGEEEVHQSQQQQQHQFHGTIPATANGNDLTSQPPAPPVKKKRNLPGNPDPTAEVIALSPTTLMATNRFVCEVCNKGFQRDQNLQLHRRGHNLPWKLKQRPTSEVRKRVYVCPETTCLHHHPSRALGDLTGIKKHYCRKHGVKKWKCDRCSKKYAVQSDWKAHTKICGTREYKCDCGTTFSRRDSFVSHRAFCEALNEEKNKANNGLSPTMNPKLQAQVSEFMMPVDASTANSPAAGLSDFNNVHDIKALPFDLMPTPLRSRAMARSINPSTTSAATLFSSSSFPSAYNGLGVVGTRMGEPTVGSARTSATALLQKAAQLGATASSGTGAAAFPITHRSFVSAMARPDRSTISPLQTLGMGVVGGGFGNRFFDTTTGEGSAVSDIGVFPGGGGDEGLIVDFMGIGRARSAAAMGFHGQQQQGVEFGGVGRQWLRGLAHSFQQQLSHGQAAMEKAMWGV